ncbi:hypothetical protein Tco_0236028 [Tanacetum coccineum]
MRYRCVVSRESILYVLDAQGPDVRFAQKLGQSISQNPGIAPLGLNVTGFCADASSACDNDETKYQTGYVFVVMGASSRREEQEAVKIAMSCNTANHMAALVAAMEGCFGLGNLLEILGGCLNKRAYYVYCDYSTAITFAQ